MNIYTSYYSGYDRKFTNALPVRISGSKPGWFRDCVELEEVYPDWEIIRAWKKGEITWEEYTERYIRTLDIYGRDYIINLLEKISREHNNCDLCLLCWESPEKPCHRHILAEYLNLGITEL